MGLIGSAVLTFIGYKQTDKPNLYIDYLKLSFLYSANYSNLHGTLTEEIDGYFFREPMGAPEVTLAKKKFEILRAKPGALAKIMT